LRQCLQDRFGGVAKSVVMSGKQPLPTELGCLVVAQAIASILSNSCEQCAYGIARRIQVYKGIQDELPSLTTAQIDTLRLARIPITRFRKPLLYPLSYEAL
jgi:hypothetical protein